MFQENRGDFDVIVDVPVSSEGAPQQPIKQIPCVIILGVNVGTGLTQGSQSLDLAIPSTDQQWGVSLARPCFQGSTLPDAFFELVQPVSGRIVHCEESGNNMLLETRPPSSAK